MLRLASRRLLSPPPRLLAAACARPLAALAARDDALRLTAREEHLDEALRIVRAYATARFDESVAVAIRLNVDVKQSHERVRGAVVLPHGTGRTVRVAVFARGELADEAIRAGAEVVGAEELVDEVVGGRMDFERVLAAPDVMPLLAKAARSLGPKGLMPNPKRGTVTTAIADAVQRMKGGELQFRAHKQGIVHSTIGLASFPNEHLRDNCLALFDAVLAERPDRFKGKPPTSLSISSTHGPAVKLDHRLW
jgi:large subunit ribosomal protein L1